MSSKDRQFIAFAEFEPDSIDFDNPKLDVAENVTPSYGAYRPIEKLTVLATLADANPLTGGYAHLLGEATPNLLLPPSGAGPLVPPMVLNWYVKDMVLLDDDEIENYGVDQVTGPAINDTTWIRTPPLLAGIEAELNLQFPEPPRIPAATNDHVLVKIRMKTIGNALGMGDHRIDYELLEDGAALDTPLTGTWTMTESEWQDFDFTMSAVQIQDIIDNDTWDKLSIHMLAECDELLADVELNSVPAADEYYDVGWGNEDGETDDMWESVNNQAGGYADVNDLSEYVDSPAIPPGGDSTIIFRYNEISLPGDPEEHGHQFMTWCTANKDNVTIRMRVLQADAPTDDEDSDDFWTFSGQQFRVFYDKDITSISTDQSTPTVTEVLETLDDGYDWAQNADPTKFVYVAFTVKYAGGGGGGSQVYLVPNARNGGGGGWSGSHTDIDNCSTGDKSDADDDALVQKTQSNDVPRYIIYKLTDGADATADSGHVLHVRMKGPTSTDYRFEVKQGAALIKDTGFRAGITTDFKWFDIPLSAGQAAAITDYSDVEVVVHVAADDGQYSISEIFFEYPGDSAAARIYETFIRSNYGASLAISDLRMETVDPKAGNIGDLNEIYVGTDTDLYEATALGFTDVTRASGDYADAALDDVANLWSFTSWGDDVIATNFADILQRKIVGGPKFTDLIHADSPYAPRAKYAAVIGGSLVLAHINPSSYDDRPYTSGKPYHLWSSYILQPDYFDTADYDNQSAIFPLVSKSGAITGLVGGEYGWVFKRNSIWRMTYVGLPPIFQFDLMAEGVGCSHPQSIVSAGGDVYFWGGGAIQRVGPNGYERLSGLRVEKYLFDTGFEELGLYNRYGNDARENDALVWGAYDAYSGLIWWLYRTFQDGQYQVSNAIIYSIVEDRFTTVSDDDLDFTLLLGQQNVVTNEPVLNRSILGFRNTGVDETTEYVKFQGDETYSGTLKSKIITPTSWGYDPGKDADLTAVRPMYISQPEVNEDYQSTELPDFHITITAAQDPAMRIGVQTETVSRIREDRQGWIPVDPMVGEFWQFEVTYPELNRATIKEFLGLQLLTNMRGDG